MHVRDGHLEAVTESIRNILAPLLLRAKEHLATTKKNEIAAAEELGRLRQLLRRDDHRPAAGRLLRE